MNYDLPYACFGNGNIANAK